MALTPMRQRSRDVRKGVNHNRRRARTLEPGTEEEPAGAQPPSGGSVIRRLTHAISVVLMISGLLVLLDVGVTLVWQEPVTAVIGYIKRSEIDKRYLSYRSAPLSRLDQQAVRSLVATSQRIGLIERSGIAKRYLGYRSAPLSRLEQQAVRSLVATSRRIIAYLARREARQVPVGAAIGRIDIRKIGASYAVVQGTDTASLEEGPGHYPATALPGLGQTVAIAGHRTTYLAPFRHIDKLESGDQIVLRMPYGRFTYVVQYHKIVPPTAVWVTRNVGYDRLVLSACNPLYSAAQRIIVFARLRNVVPLGVAPALASTSD